MSLAKVVSYKPKRYKLNDSFNIVRTVRIMIFHRFTIFKISKIMSEEVESNVFVNGTDKVKRELVFNDYESAKRYSEKLAKI
ncbi:gp48 [Sphingomonas phage PAU]|uniref:gp48 n=1 Tax=Sphingomonas phage PAU TaxID=1150991 RepID=UPI0002573135|nr:gp48 [Sphingomonas phage PAU]AFF28046.1 gp48 [Sphingomonas phage PAU]